MEIMKYKPERGENFMTVIAANRVGIYLNGNLIDSPCKNYCPDDVRKAIDDFLEIAYEEGVRNTLMTIQNDLFKIVCAEKPPGMSRLRDT